MQSLCWRWFNIENYFNNKQKEPAMQSPVSYTQEYLTNMKYCVECNSKIIEKEQRSCISPTATKQASATNHVVEGGRKERSSDKGEDEYSGIIRNIDIGRTVVSTEEQEEEEEEEEEEKENIENVTSQLRMENSTMH